MVLTNNRISLYQKWLSKTFQEIELNYYREIDELTQKLNDIDLPRNTTIPDFTLREFNFITQWEQGLLSSGDVCDVFDKIDVHQAARGRLTKRLLNFMMNNETLADYVKPVITAVENSCLETMEKYITMMHRYFTKMDEIDQDQIQITWVEQIFQHSDMRLRHIDMPLNQAIKHIEAFILKDLNQKFYIQDQIVVFDEDLGQEDRVIHWIFGPRTYVELIKALFEIRETLTDADTSIYLKKLMGNYAE